jgi:hypothetical protein
MKSMVKLKTYSATCTIPFVENLSTETASNAIFLPAQAFLLDFFVTREALGT